MQVQREDGRNETFRVHAHFCMFILSTPFINMEDIVAKNVFYMYKKKVKMDYMHGFFLLASACIYFAKTAGSTRA